MKPLCLIFFISMQLHAQLPSGNWHGELQLNDTLYLPFVFTTDNNQLIIQNGEEKIVVNEITYRKDSVFIQMPIFDSEFRCKLNNNGMSGNFYNHARTSLNILPFHAYYGLPFRFSDKPERTTVNITGRYHVVFDSDDDESKNAVGVFKQEGNLLTATFLTTTGDYRYLEGEVNGNRLWLSAFDGSHLFLFTAMVKNDSLINGEFFSGRHWHDTWNGRRDEQAKLISADSLTFLKPGFDKISFSFPDENGKMISLSDPQFENKAMIIQLMGSWCPNCMDETKFLSDWYTKERKGNIEIIALDFERIVDNANASKNIKRLKKQFGINYTVLYAGTADKKVAATTLPMLNRIFAFPTTIYLDRKKNVVKINTGFSGPATGVEFEKFKEDFNELVRQKMK